jgi:cytochrome c-type biogenesis protein CcmE
MNKKTIVKTIIAVVLIGGGMTYFIFQAMQSSWAYYYSVDDFAANRAAVKNHSLRLAGRVKKDSIVRDLQNTSLKFILSGFETELPIHYKGTVPDNFDDDIEVVIEGRLDTEGIFQADRLMTKCESKYKAKVK